MTASYSKRQIIRAEAYHVKTDSMVRQIERMSACGLDESQIAYCTGLDVVTLRQHYKEEMDMGLAMVTAQIGAAQIKAALRGDSNAAQFMLRSRAHWVTPTKIDADVTVTVHDKRKEMDEIVKLMHESGRPPVTIDQPPSAVSVPDQKKLLKQATAPKGKLS
jgi:hypothetical protein